MYQNHAFDLVCILRQLVGLVTYSFHDLCKVVHNWEVLSVDLYVSFMSRTADIEWCK
jgi:hypothetical protein